MERQQTRSGPSYSLQGWLQPAEVVKKVLFSGLFPASFQGKEGGSHGRVRVTFTAAVHSSSWCCSSRRSGVCSVCLTNSLQQSEITVLCQKTLLSSPASHIKPLYGQAALRYSDFTFPVPQGLLIEKSTPCSNTSHHAQGCKAELYPQHQSSNPTKSFHCPPRSCGT